MKKKVLVIGRHQEMLHTVLQQLEEAGYEASGATENEEALHLFRHFLPDAVIIGGGVDSASRTVFQEQFLSLKPDVKMIPAHPQTVLASLAAALNT